jgi:L-fuculose-phosphate aldolase
VNAYTVNASAFGVTDSSLDTRTIPESYLFLRDVQRIPYGIQFRDCLAFAERLSQEKSICLLENDGVLVTGKDVLDTFDRLEVLESTAEAIINSRPLGDVVPMSQKIIDQLELAFLPGDT